MGCDESHLIVPTIESKVNKSRNNVRSKGNTRDLGSEVDSIKKPKSHHKSKQAETMDTRELDENSNFGGFKAKAKRSKSAKQI